MAERDRHQELCRDRGILPAVRCRDAKPDRGNRRRGGKAQARALGPARRDLEFLKCRFAPESAAPWHRRANPCEAAAHVRGLNALRSPPDEKGFPRICGRYCGRARRGVSRRARASGAAKRVGRARGTAGDGRSTHDRPSPAARAAPTAAQAPAPGGSRRAETVAMRTKQTARTSSIRAMSSGHFASHRHHPSTAAVRLACGRPWVAPSVMGGADAVGVGRRPCPRRDP